ncbi:hypothetical protein [Cutibacterium porci]|nr:hypothetical protein [Cutibacterium porci]
MGIDADVSGDHAATSVGDIPLVPIVEELDGHHRDDWRMVVDELVTRMVRSLLDGATRLTDATLAEHVVVKVVGDRERAGRSFDYARPLVSTVTGKPVPGLVVALAWFDGGVELLNDAALAEVSDLDAAYRRGTENLASALVNGLSLSRDGDIVTVTGSSWLVSSWLLVPQAGGPIADELGDSVVVGIETPDRVVVAAQGHEKQIDEALSASRIADPFPWRLTGQNV